MLNNFQSTLTCPRLLNLPIITLFRQIQEDEKTVGYVWIIQMKE